jgi:hypothetical protein
LESDIIGQFLGEKKSSEPSVGMKKSKQKMHQSGDPVNLKI